MGLLARKKSLPVLLPPQTDSSLCSMRPFSGGGGSMALSLRPGPGAALNCPEPEAGPQAAGLSSVGPSFVICR